MVGIVLEISRSEYGADIEWRVPGSKTEGLLRGWLHSPPFPFAGRQWQLELGLEDPRSGISSVLLSLYRGYAPSPVTLVRYWLGARRGDGVEEIARGRREPVSSVAEHPWLLFIELKKRMGFFAPSGTLSFIARLRTGPEIDGEMKSLLELSFIESGQLIKEATPTGLEAEAEQNAAVAECELSFRRFRTSNPHNAANVFPGPSGQQPSDECVLCCEEAVDCALYRCGHMCMCYACAIKVKNREDSAKCPICRTTIQDVLKVYK